MHFDEIFQKIGLGVVQRYLVLCCLLVGFVEGFLYTGIWILDSYVGSVYNLEWFEQRNLYIYFFVGNIIGPTLLGGISDVSGRLSTLKASCVACYVACIFGAASPLLTTYKFSCYALGFSLAGIQTGSRILLFETLPIDHRGSYVVIIDIISNLGSLCALGWSCVIVNYNPEFGFLKLWQLFFFVGALICMMGSCFVATMPFSVRQMHCHQRIATVNIMLKKFYTLNKFEHGSLYLNRSIEPFSYVEARYYRREKWSDGIIFCINCVWSYVRSTISSNFIAETIILALFHVLFFRGTWLLNCILSEMLKDSYVDCIMLNNMGNNYTLTEFYQTFPSVENYYLKLSSLLAPMSVFFIVDRYPRKLLMAASCFCTSISYFGLVQHFKYAFQLPIALTFMFFQSSSKIILNILTFETYPTKFRGTADGILKSLSNIGIFNILLIYQKFCLNIFLFFYFALVAFILGALAAIRYQNKKTPSV